MNVNDVWNAAKALQGVILDRWTKSRKKGAEFTYQIRDKGRGPGIGFLREGREVKQAGFDVFVEVYEKWLRGQRSVDEIRNNGPNGSRKEAVFFLFPIYEMVERSLALSEVDLQTSESATDIAEPPSRVETVISRIIRDTALCQRLKEIHQYRCQMAECDFMMGGCTAKLITFDHSVAGTMVQIPKATSSSSARIITRCSTTE